MRRRGACHVHALSAPLLAAAWLSATYDGALAATAVILGLGSEVRF